MSQATGIKVSNKEGILAATRMGEWWLSKFAPILATFYATVSLVKWPLLPLLPRLLVLLAALVVGAVYVSVVNDWTDRADDEAGAKANRSSGRSSGFMCTVLGSCLALGLGFGVYFWQLSRQSGLFYLGSWLAYSLYSLPPIRLKSRGFMGVLADACGAYLFPLLLAVSVASQWTRQPLPLAWYLAIGSWALACGLRNILWHQLGDAAADAQANVDTFVRRVGFRAAQRLGQLVVFPVEVAAFIVVLWLGGQKLVLVCALLYGVIEVCRLRLWRLRPQVLEPNSSLVLSDFYQFFYPLGLLVAQSLRYPTDVVALLLHELFFWPAAWELIQEAWLYTALVLRKSIGR